MNLLSDISWDKLYTELVDFVQGKIKDRATAEDIVQEVFIKVHTKSSQLKETEKISAWIFQITRHAVADHFRKKRRDLDPTIIDWETSGHEFNECVANCLSVLLHTLPDKYREPLELAEVKNLSQQDVAEKLGISYSGARSRVQRARKMLKAKLDELYYIKTDPYGNVIHCEDKIPCCCRGES